MKKDLIEKKKELEIQLIKVNAEINLEVLREDLEALQQITDELNSLFQNKIVEKYGDNYWRDSSENASNLLYDAMQILDKSSVQLEKEIEEIEAELNSKKD